MPLTLLIAANLLGIAAYAAATRLKVRREQRNIASVALAIVDYFQRSGVNVACSCTRLSGKTTYTAFVESEPMKRFRLSHIIEMPLCEHVRKSCGLELGKVYWRFPIQEVTGMNTVTRATNAPEAVKEQVREAQGKEAAPAPRKTPDEYINEGLEHYKYIPKVEATELSWEHFEQVSGNTDGGGRPVQ